MSSQSSAAPSLWEGGRSPYATNSKKFGMWLFIISDSLTFSAMLFAYTYSRVTNPDWPKPFDFSPAIVFASMMTFCLLSSSLTMVMAVHAMNHGNRKATVRWILATMAGGGAFVVLQCRGRDAFQEPLGRPAVWRHLFCADRPAHDSRDLRAHLPDDRRDGYRAGQV
jgi:heme/copper-type cytochrome/quinol oxidase subunit 3